MKAYRPPCDADIAPPPVVWARVAVVGGKRGAVLVRAGLLTPYTVQTIAEDAVRAGDGAELDLTLAAGTTVGALARVHERFASLEQRGVRVTVHCEHHNAAARCMRPARVAVR